MRRFEGEYLIEVEGVSFTYPDGTRALRGVSAKVRHRSVVAITGANGSGKSTLLMLMAGLLEPQEGVVRFRGVEVKRLGYELRREVGVVFQDPDDQLFAPTVFDDIAFGLRILRLPDQEVRLRVNEVARELGVEHLLDKPPFRLSGGEKRKVALATALVLRPSVLLLDEPFSELSPQASRRLMDMISEYKKGGGTVVFTSHDVDVVAELSDYVYVLHEGRVVAHGRPEEVLCDDELLARAELRPPTATMLYRELIGRGRRCPIRVSELLAELKRVFRALEARATT